MKLLKFTRFLSMILAAVGFSVAASSCGGDEEADKADCYVCTGSDGTETYCFSDYVDDGYTREEFDEYIDELRGEGYTCNAVG